MVGAIEAELVWREGKGGAGRSERQPLDLIQKGLTPLLLLSAGPWRPLSVGSQCSSCQGSLRWVWALIVACFGDSE